ncbi:MAG: hypothetical protein ACP5NK_03610 [Thermoplasmata archaeon]
MMKYIIKFSYDGTRFSGYQRGNGERSVEDTIQREIDRLGINSEIRSAARTDRGVSAVSNVFSVEYGDRIEKLMGILNSQIAEMSFHSFAAVDEKFNPRHCTMKWYRYYLFREVNIEGLVHVLGKFRGTHDFRNFCRSDGRNTIRSISEIKVGSENRSTFIDFYAQSFLWQQIRTIMAYAVQHSEGPDDSDPFATSERYGGIAVPQSLILMDINYESVGFTRYRSRSKEKFLERNLNEIRSRYTFLSLEMDNLKRSGIYSDFDFKEPGTSSEG